MNQGLDDSVIILEPGSSNSSIKSCQDSLSSNDDELLLCDNDSSVEIVDEELEISVVKESEDHVLDHCTEEVSIIFDSAEKRIRQINEALKEYLEEREDQEKSDHEIPDCEDPIRNNKDIIWDEKKA